MDNNWKNRIYTSIGDIADLEYQKTAWLGKSQLASSFDEIINVLYNDNFFEEFIKDEFWNEVGREKTALHIELEKLNSMINDYEEPGDEKEILNDPEWIKITEQAKKIIRIWDLPLPGV